MSRLVPAIIVALLVCSLPAMGVGGLGPADEPGVSASEIDSFHTEAIEADYLRSNVTVNRLAVPTVNESEYASATPELGSSLLDVDDAIRTEFHLKTIESEWGELNHTQRIERLQWALDRIDQRIATIDERERSIVEAHANGEVSGDSVLRVIDQNHEKVLELSEFIDRVATLSDDVSEISVPTRDLNAQVETYTTPIRDRIASEDETVLVQTGETGVTLHALDGETYLRETVRYEYRDLDGSEQFTDLQEVRDISDDRYPWAAANNFGVSVTRFPAMNLFRVAYSPHFHGDTHTYLDAVTGHVFKESQVLDVSNLPIVADDEFIEDGVRITIEETPMDGPVEISFFDAETDEPLTEAEIAIDGVIIGETDASGHMWVVPPGDTYEVAVIDHDVSVSVTREN